MKHHAEFIAKLIAFASNTGRALQIAFKLDRANTIGLIISALMVACLPVLTTLVWRGLVNEVAAPDTRSLDTVMIWAELLVVVTLAQIIVSQADAYFNNVLKLNLTVRINADTLK